MTTKDVRFDLLTTAEGVAFVAEELHDGRRTMPHGRRVVAGMSMADVRALHEALLVLLTDDGR